MVFPVFITSSTQECRVKCTTTTRCKVNGAFNWLHLEIHTNLQFVSLTTGFLPLHRWSPVGSCSSCVCLHLHLARHVLGSKFLLRWNQNSPTSSGRVGTHANALHLHAPALQGTRLLLAGKMKSIQVHLLPFKIRNLLCDRCRYSCWNKILIL